MSTYASFKHTNITSLGAVQLKHHEDDASQIIIGAFTYNTLSMRYTYVQATVHKYRLSFTQDQLLCKILEPSKHLNTHLSTTSNRQQRPWRQLSYFAEILNKLLRLLIAPEAPVRDESRVPQRTSRGQIPNTSTKITWTLIAPKNASSSNNFNT